jgi:hypothetical protein
MLLVGGCKIYTEEWKNDKSEKDRFADGTSLIVHPSTYAGMLADG